MPAGGSPDRGRLRVWSGRFGFVFLFCACSSLFSGRFFRVTGWPGCEDLCSAHCVCPARRCDASVTQITEQGLTESTQASSTWSAPVCLCVPHMLGWTSLPFTEWRGRVWAPREWERSRCVSLTSADERGSPDIVSESQQLKVRCQEDEPAFSHLRPTLWGSGASAHVTSSEKRLPVTPCSRVPVTAVLVSLVPGSWRRTCFVGPQSPVCRHRPPGSLLRLTALLLTLPVRPGGPSVTTRALQRQAAPAHACPAAALLAQQAQPCAAGPPHTPHRKHTGPSPGWLEAAQWPRAHAPRPSFILSSVTLRRRLRPPCLSVPSAEWRCWGSCLGCELSCKAGWPRAQGALRCRM